MPMGGGAFTAQNKILPGAYINFVSATGAAKMGERGVAALPLELSWGAEGQVFALTAADFGRAAWETLGYPAEAAELLLVREALKRAKTLLVYRVNGGGEKASVTLGGLTATARHGGTRGNDLRVGLLANADDEAAVDVVTWLAGTEADRQTVAKAAGGGALRDNAFLTFAATEALSAAAAAPLTGGSNGTVNGASYVEALAALEPESFQVLGYPGTDEEVKALVCAFVKRLRGDEGRKVVGVLHQYAKADEIGIISVKNGVVLEGGMTVPGEKAVAWVTGASAAAAVNQSLTETAYDGAVDVDIKYTKSQMEAAITGGEFVFYADSGKARVLADINSRTSFDTTVSADWSSNRVLRVMDGWANDVARLFGRSYLGVQTNSETGRSLFHADLVALGKQYEALDAISGFSPEAVAVRQGAGKRDVAVDCVLQPNDSMEKLYMTVTVR